MMGKKKDRFCSITEKGGIVALLVTRKTVSVFLYSLKIYISLTMKPFLKVNANKLATLLSSPNLNKNLSYLHIFLFYFPSEHIKIHSESSSEHLIRMQTLNVLHASQCVRPHADHLLVHHWL